MSLLDTDVLGWDSYDNIHDYVHFAHDVYQYKYHLTLTCGYKPSQLTLKQGVKLVLYEVGNYVDECQFIVSIEYQPDSGRPHAHCHIETSEPLNRTLLRKLQGLFTSKIGFSKFEVCADSQKNIQYLYKDVQKNEEQYKMSHLYEFVKI